MLSPDGYSQSQRAFAVTRQGQIFAIGTFRDSYQIREIITESVVGTFEHSPSGWVIAWTKFRELEERHMVPEVKEMAPRARINRDAFVASDGSSFVSDVARNAGTTSGTAAVWHRIGVGLVCAGIAIITASLGSIAYLFATGLTMGTGTLVIMLLAWSGLGYWVNFEPGIGLSREPSYHQARLLARLGLYTTAALFGVLLDVYLALVLSDHGIQYFPFVMVGCSPAAFIFIVWHFFVQREQLRRGIQ